MSKTAVKDHTEFILPTAVISKVDVARLVREFETVDNTLTEKSVRKKTNASQEQVPALSAQLVAFLEDNPVDLEDARARSAYIKQLRLLKDHVRVMNITFAVVADPESLRELSAWLRESIHPQTVLDVHLQPGLVAGAYVRSQNHVFDFSVRNALKSKRGELKKELEMLRG